MQVGLQEQSGASALRQRSNPAAACELSSICQMLHSVDEDCHPGVSGVSAAMCSVLIIDVAEAGMKLVQPGHSMSENFKRSHRGSLWHGQP